MKFGAQKQIPIKMTVISQNSKFSKFKMAFKIVTEDVCVIEAMIPRLPLIAK